MVLLEEIVNSREKKSFLFQIAGRIGGKEFLTTVEAHTGNHNPSYINSHGLSEEIFIGSNVLFDCRSRSTAVNVASKFYYAEWTSRDMSLCAVDATSSHYSYNF